MSQGAVFKVFGPPWPIFLVGPDIIGLGMSGRTAGLYHVLSVFVVPSVSMESAMESNDVLMTCFCAVSLSGTMRSAASF